MSPTSLARHASASLLLAGLVFVRPGFARQEPAAAPASGPAGLSLRVAETSARSQALLNPEAGDWKTLPAQRVALNRTPRLYETESPSDPEIPFVDVRAARSEGKLLVLLAWHDSSEDTARISPPPAAPTEGRYEREQTEASDRFFDAAAVMYPARPPEAGAWPALQMGDAGGPVLIYYWNAARGTARMQAEGRGTTRRTGEGFPAQSSYQDASWLLTMELPGVPAGTPLALAIWNGSQQDRDGRKYFTTWLRLE